MAEVAFDTRATGNSPIAAFETFLLRAPIAEPVRTSFGTMRDRPAVFVRLIDGDGFEGWGEIWCNFPAQGAEHRARLAEGIFRPLLEGRAFTSPAELSAELERKVRILTVQAGEPGPFSQVIAGIDCALWDLAARRAGIALWRMLGGSGSPVVPVYASGINPQGVAETVALQRASGHRAFKLKIGFDEKHDIANIAEARRLIGAGDRLMVDANQAWSLEDAIRMCARLQDFDLAWIEEPIPADSSADAWKALRARTATPLAAGENLGSRDRFDAAIQQRLFDVLQPDCAKWGGITGCLAVARSALAHRLRYCPHFLGSGIGLAFSAHLLKAVGGDGLLEIDINENPLREAIAPWSSRPDRGTVNLPEGPGIGMAPDPEWLETYRIRW